VTGNDWGVVEKAMVVLIVIVYAFIAVQLFQP
jgi:hypothetical protein